MASVPSRDGRAIRANETVMIVEPQASGGAWLRLAAECAAQLDASAVVIGTGPEARTAAASGLRVVAACAAPLNSPLLGWRTLARTFAPYARGCVAVAWSPLAAALGAALAHRVVAVSPSAPAQPDVRWLLARAARGRAIVDVIPAHPLAAEGWPRSTYWRVHAPFPALPNVVAAGDRLELRRAWRVDDQTCVVGLIGSPVTVSHASRMLDILARAALTGHRMALVLHPDACHARRAQRWAMLAPDLVQLILEPTLAESWRVAPGLDAAICSDSWRAPTVARGPLVLAASALASGGADSSVPGGAIDALLLARMGVPLLATRQSAAAAFVGSWPELVFDERRPNAAVRALKAVAMSGRSAFAAQGLAAAALPGSADLVARIRQLVAPQRAAA